MIVISSSTADPVLVFQLSEMEVRLKIENKKTLVIQTYPMLSSKLQCVMIFVVVIPRSL